VSPWIFQYLSILLWRDLLAKQLIGSSSGMIHSGFDGGGGIIPIQFDKNPVVHGHFKEFDKTVLDAAGKGPSQVSGIGIVLQGDTAVLIIGSPAIVSLRVIVGILLRGLIVNGFRSLISSFQTALNGLQSAYGDFERF
jgi:hypothetical protein